MRKRQCDTGQSGTMYSAAAVQLMPLLIFCCVHRGSDSQCFSMNRTTAKNCSIPLGDLDPIWYMIPWAHPSQPPKRHPNQFSCFHRAHECVQRTDRQTHRPNDHATPSVAIGRVLAIASVRPTNWKKSIAVDYSILFNNIVIIIMEHNRKWPSYTNKEHIYMLPWTSKLEIM